MEYENPRGDVLAILREHPGRSLNEVKSAVSKAISGQVKAVLEQLEKDRIVDRRLDQSKRSRYWLRDKG